MPERVYQCTNINCSNYRNPVVVAGRRLGIDFYEWPNIVCVCGMEPVIVYPPPVRCPSCRQRITPALTSCSDPTHDLPRGGS